MHRNRANSGVGNFMVQWFLNFVFIEPAEALHSKFPPKLSISLREGGIFSEGSLVFTAVVQDLSSFAGGDYLFLNLTKMAVGVQMGEEKLLVKSGRHSVHRASGLKKSKNIPVKYSYFDAQKRKWKLLSASTLVLRPTRREICIFHWDSKYKRVNYHGITFPVTP